jgi:hypothetical protein
MVTIQELEKRVECLRMITQRENELFKGSHKAARSSVQ